MRAILITVSASLLLSSLAFSQDGDAPSPKLLLTPQRLRRLQRDRERQTVRWTDFENRVQSVPDSSERGFELALYYAITHDEKRGREAVEWALSHKCSPRQVALILDWCGALFSADQKAQLTPPCVIYQVSGKPPPAAMNERDVLFSAVARGQDANEATGAWKQLLSELQNGQFTNAEALYASIEYLVATRAVRHVDLREDAPAFFSGLPVELLLSLTPEQAQHPSWMTHVAALALIGLDPNLEGSQFLQGWALEDAQMLRDGPGVAYELLWADPYLPGVGYQNLDPWIYDANGRLFARTTWDTNACWIALSSRGAEQENCPTGWQPLTTHFGHLILVPAVERCTEIARRKDGKDVVVLWKMRPHQNISYVIGKQKSTAEADAAGMWRMPENVEGKVCTQP